MEMKKLYPLLVLVLIMVITGCGSGGSDVASGHHDDATLSSAKAITTFNFTSPAATGTITEGTHTIVVTVPDGTDVTALTPTITYTGASINPDTGVSNDFTNVVTYTVTAADATTQNYTVTLKYGYTSANIGTLKYVPAGSFQRDVTATDISTVTTAFRMSQREITQAQYFAVTGSAQSWFTSAHGYTDDTTRPVEMVSWYDAVEFCNDLSTLEGFTPVYTITDRVPGDGNHPITSATVIVNWANNGYRLPTEMEWMWAAMGATSDRSNGYTGTGTNTTGYTKGYAGSTEAGSAYANIGDYAWTSENSSTSQPVGTKLPNELGLYDMSGNVFEWVWDWYDDYPDGELASDTDAGRGAASGEYRLMRGGSWMHSSFYATVAYRGYYSDPHGWWDNWVGFRVVRP
jgi:sulfatase modifying factor 1